MVRNDNLNRRNILKLTSGAVATAGLTGLASAKEKVEVNVGFANERGKNAAEQVADSVKRRFSFNAITLELPRQAAENLATNPNIRYVEENGEMHALSQETPYGIEQVDADLAIDDGYTGDGANIAVIDTGIDLQHETLEGNLADGDDQHFAAEDAECDADCGGGGGPPWQRGGNAIEECIAPWDDDQDHGSHCAGTAAAEDNGEGVLGVAPDATLHAVKVLDCEGSGSWDGVAAGIEWSAENDNVDVLSMSLGGDESDVIRDAVKYADQQGKVQVAAAGNDGECTDCVGYPAAYDEVIAVSATDENDDLADFSSTGPEVELAAPGVDVLSTIPCDEYEEFSGTSMACPHVSGAVATLIAAGVAPEDVREILKDSAEDINLDDNEQGAGRLNVADALAIADTDDEEEDDEEEDDEEDEEEDPENAPNIDTFELADASNPQWARVEVDWAVSDADGALDDVTSVINDGVDSESSNVSGSTASGEHELRERNGHGEASVTLTVTDSAGNSTSETKSITL